MVREYLKLSPGPPSPVLPSEPPQQEVRGPAGGGEVGSQCDHPTQQQELTGGPAGWDPPQFSSTDVRERMNKEQLSPSSLVTLFTRLCHQKPAGGFKGPKILSSDFCPFCNQGNTCLGQCCKGREEPPKRKAVWSRNQEFLIPGLDRSNMASSTVLTTRTFTFTKRIKVSPLSPNSPIFHPVHQNTSHPTASISFKTSLSSTKTSKPKLSNPGWYEENEHLQKKLRMILLHTSLKSHTTKKHQKKHQKKKSEKTQCNSYMRKLSISELSCTKKTSQINSPNSPLTPSITPSISSSTTLSKAPNTLSSSKSSFNYSQILDFLQTEWKLAEGSEIFGTEKSFKAEQKLTDQESSCPVLLSPTKLPHLPTPPNLLQPRSRELQQQDTISPSLTPSSSLQEIEIFRSSPPSGRQRSLISGRKRRQSSSPESQTTHTHQRLLKFCRAGNAAYT
jgi:hypothetical protein